MISSAYSEENESFRASLRRFVDEHIAPSGVDVDRDEVFPRENVRQLAEMGMSGIGIAPAYGGLGATRVQACIAIEEVSRGCASTAMALMANLHSSGVVQAAGTEEQCASWLPGVASGERLAGVAITEPDSGTDIGSMRTIAEETKDGFRIRGSKIYITNGGVADFYVVFARYGPGERKQGLSAFIVPAETPGLRVGQPLKKLGLRGSLTSELFLDDVLVGREALLGGPGQGHQLAVDSLDGARISTAAQALGLARASLEVAFRFANERVQFGRPVGEFQAVQLRLADMIVGSETISALLYQAAATYDAVAAGPKRSLAASIAKIYCTDAAAEICNQTVVLLGGLGFMREAIVERYLRDVKGTQIYDGTNDINRLNVVRQTHSVGLD